MKITRAVQHIPLAAAHPGKLAKLDALSAVYLALVQQYVTHFTSLSLARQVCAALFREYVV